MKKYIVPFILLAALSFGASAQSSHKLQGPAYKNRKPWKDPKPATTLAVKDGETKKGAGVKTLLPFERKTGDVKEFQVVIHKNELQGPAYKNRKIWKKDTSSEDTEPLVAEQR